MAILQPRRVTPYSCLDGILLRKAVVEMEAACSVPSPRSHQGLDNPSTQLLRLLHPKPPKALSRTDKLPRSVDVCPCPTSRRWVWLPSRLQQIFCYVRSPSEAF
ncbi:unnamed protein product [Symbiodinium natans]|uniref:Uncharacterized protein n=1 Tax=Symbiodinium natans TaxID=878477 RepID=A0A812SY43_9DINO|nr:unnamed protein product [Symbiodinium natans]